MLCAPIAAMAQGAIMQVTTYTRTLNDMAADATPLRPMARLVDPKALPPSRLLQNNARPSSFGKAGVAGGQGAKPKLAPDAYGYDNGLTPIAPYTTAGAYADYGGPMPTASAVAVTSYPWRAAGQLTFSIGNNRYRCSGSMIGPGILLTAAHCVYDYGTGTQSGFHTNYVFSPGFSDTAVLGSWTGYAAFVPSVYYYGSDSCEERGVVCANDLAIIIMNRNSAGQLPGQVVGYYNYGWNGYSYVTSFGNAFLSHITQLGYPEAFDSGQRMERTDGIGALVGVSDGTYNTILGGAQTAGSSGGPWLVNFGASPSLSGTDLGNSAVPNVVVGVTSWGYTDASIKTQGASWFGQNSQFPAASYPDSRGVVRGAGNIGFMVAQACTYFPKHCS